MSLTELLLQAKTKKAEEFLFVVGSEPRVRLSSGWESLRTSPALVTEWNLLQQSLLSAQQKTVLDKYGILQGETFFEDVRIGFSFFQQDSTMKAVLDMNLDGGKQDIPVPPALLDVCLRMKGLVVLSGPNDIGLLWVLHRLLHKMSEEKSFLGAVISPTAFPQVRESKSCYVYHSGDFQTAREKKSFLSGVDMVVYNADYDPQTFQEAVEMSEEGKFVIYTMKAPSVANTLRRCLAAMEKSFGMHGAPRLAESLQFVSSQYAVAGLAGEKVFAYESLLIKPQIRSLIMEQNIKSIEELMGATTESTGVLTLNQSLLQHLVRRRIDIKTAFEVSRDPDNLDLLLKKVGI